MRFSIAVSIAVFLLISLGAIDCQNRAPMEEMAAESTESAITEAVAVLSPTEGNTAHGVVTFNKTVDGIKIVADMEGLSPGKHGFHIHEFGDCTAPDAVSAGGHFNPDNMPHGAPSDMERHVGDLGNLEANEEGMAHYERTDNLISLSGPHSIIGLSVVVHAGEDDLTSQPSGNAGPRVACGVIGVANSMK
jgi:Cu-Zn family superoxide dismutase